MKKSNSQLKIKLSFLILSFLILILSSLSSTGKNEDIPRFDWNVFEGSDRANITIHEIWDFEDLTSAKVKRYIRLENVQFDFIVFDESFPAYSEKSIWDYAQYDLTEGQTALKSIDEEFGVFINREWYIDKNFIENNTKLVTRIPQIPVKNKNYSLLLEEFHVSNQLKYVGPKNFLTFNSSRNFWFPFDKYEFQRNLSKVQSDYIYSAKIVLPKYFSIFVINDSSISEGAFIPEKIIRPAYMYQNGTVAKVLSPIRMVILGAQIRFLDGPYTEENRQIVIVPPTFMISNQNSLTNVSILPQQLSVRGVIVERPVLLKQIFILTILLSAFFLLLGFKLKNVFGYITVLIALFTAQQAIAGIALPGRPESVTLYDLAIVFGVLIGTFFYLIWKIKDVLKGSFIFILKLMFSITHQITIIGCKIVKKLSRLIKKGILKIKNVKIVE